jgi:hypothetical protein
MTMDPLNTCNACEAEIKTPNPMGYCDDCLKDSEQESIRMLGERRVRPQQLAPVLAGDFYKSQGRFIRAAAMYRKAFLGAGGHAFAAMMQSRMDECLDLARKGKD